MRAISSSVSVIGMVMAEARMMSFVNVPCVASSTFFAPGPKAKISPSSITPVDVGDGDGSWPASSSCSSRSGVTRLRFRVHAYPASAAPSPPSIFAAAIRLHPASTTGAASVLQPR